MHAARPPHTGPHSWRGRSRPCIRRLREAEHERAAAAAAAAVLCGAVRGGAGATPAGPGRRCRRGRKAGTCRAATTALPRHPGATPRTGARCASPKHASGRRWPSAGGSSTGGACRTRVPSCPPPNLDAASSPTSRPCAALRQPQPPPRARPAPNPSAHSDGAQPCRECCVTHRWP
jgi:hypothetical protein